MCVFVTNACVFARINCYGNRINECYTCSNVNGWKEKWVWKITMILWHFICIFIFNKACPLPLSIFSFSFTFSKSESIWCGCFLQKHTRFHFLSFSLSSHLIIWVIQSHCNRVVEFILLFMRVAKYSYTHSYR